MEQHEQEFCVDFVLAWEEFISPFQQSACESIAEEKRRIFETNLERVGLLLHREDFKHLHFVKIHATKDTLCRYAEFLKLHMPVSFDHSPMPCDTKRRGLRKLSAFLTVDPKVLKPKTHRLTEEFRCDRKFLFDVDAEDFFSQSIRSFIVNFILHREKFGQEDRDFGIQRLISENVYTAAYPLHDGDTEPSMQHALACEWASVSKFYKLQPIDHIREYFGVKFALYFAWLGFYTYMLIPAAVFGLVCFTYGASTTYSNTFSKDICSEQHDIIMCPLCDRICKYWNLREACLYARVTHLFDNPMNVVLAIGMCLWCMHV